MSRSFDPFDELAAMFLTSPAPSAGAPENNALPAANGHASHARPAAPIEVLIAGHLPVRGGLWLTPYADAVARECGCAAMIRLEQDQSSLQVLGAASDQVEIDSSQPLHQALRRIGTVIDRWIVRASADSKPADVLSAGADHITILSSADEAATVAAYQIIKDYSQAAEALGLPLPSMGLAIVGVDANTAATVIERLNRTTGSFLGVEAKLVRCLPRIDTGIKSTRCLMFPGHANPTLGDLMTWIDQIRTVVAQQPHDSQSVAGKLYSDRDANVMSAEQILREPAAPNFPALQPFSPFLPQQPASNPYRMPTAPETPLRAASAPVAPTWTPRVEFPVPSIGNSRPSPGQAMAMPSAKLAPKPTIDVEPKGAVRPTEPDADGKPVSLTSYIAGLTVLPFRSPGHERVEIAVDQSGGLHLVAREQSLRELPVVESWARAHRELISLAYPQHAIDYSRRIVSHIFTAEPVSVADLHGGELHLHLLAPVVVNGTTGWYAAPLNAIAR